MAEKEELHLQANFVTHFFQQEVNLLSGVRGEIEYIIDDFQGMSTFLSVVDAKEENDQELKVWSNKSMILLMALKIFRQNNSHAWLTVSESINIEDLMKDMIQQLFAEILRYVVVFDDVWKVDVWEAVKSVLPDNNCGSRVILTTCLSNIASSTYCNETDGNVYTFMLLSSEESWMLFCNKTFRGNLCPPHLKEISHKFFKKFNALPLAIVVISGMKDQRRIDKWEMIYRNLGAELEGNDRLESMKKALSLSCNYLPDYLKTCF
ncbi:hypothetical protein ACSBR2_014156 [Camellia fascicularis]